MLAPVVNVHTEAAYPRLGAYSDKFESNLLVAGESIVVISYQTFSRTGFDHDALITYLSLKKPPA